MKILSRKMTIWIGVVAILILMACLAFKFCSVKPSEQIFAAAANGDLELLKSLEQKGGSLNLQNARMHSWTPLIGAIYFSKTNTIQYLIGRGVDLNLRDRDGQTALMWAVRVVDTNTVKLLLESGADTTIKDIDGVDALSDAKGNESRAVLLPLFQNKTSNKNAAN